jgi:hypothetical protein
MIKNPLSFLRIRNIRDPSEQWKLTAREWLFRCVCRHRQGSKHNILWFCSRRGGSTWIINAIAALPGMRYVGRPFQTALYSRWRDMIPSLCEAADHEDRRNFECFVQFKGEAEDQFLQFARSIVLAQRHIYPTLHFGAPYFHRVTDRVVFQMTNETAMIEWFDEHLPASTVLYLRHPIPTALSIMERKWRPECCDFLDHRSFVETHLTGRQVDLARLVMDKGPDLARHVLDWTLKMLMPIRAAASGRHPDWLVLTYEETVRHPDRTIEVLSEHLDLPDRASMRAQLQRPSRTVTKGTASKVNDHQYLLERWRKQVSDSDEIELMRIPAEFGLNVYVGGRSLPVEGYFQ